MIYYNKSVVHVYYYNIIHTNCALFCHSESKHSACLLFSTLNVWYYIHGIPVLKLQ